MRKRLKLPLTASDVWRRLGEMYEQRLIGVAPGVDAKDMDDLALYCYLVAEVTR